MALDADVCCVILVSMRLTENERLELWGMRHSFAAADPAHAVGEFTQGITDLLDYSGGP